MHGPFVARSPLRSRNRDRRTAVLCVAVSRCLLKTDVSDTVRQSEGDSEWVRANWENGCA